MSKECRSATLAIASTISDAPFDASAPIDGHGAGGDWLAPRSDRPTLGAARA